MDEADYGIDETPTTERQLEDLRLAVRAALREAPAVMTAEEGPGFLFRGDVVGRLREMVKHVSIYDDDYDAGDGEGDFDTEADQEWRASIGVRPRLFTAEQEAQYAAAQQVNYAADTRQ